MAVPSISIPFDKGEPPQAPSEAPQLQ